MHDATPSCQLGDARTGDSSAISTPQQHNPATPTAPDATTWRPVPKDEQELAHTTSRRTGPRRWLKAVTALIGFGIHPKANQTTLRVADDLATRMGFDTGHAVYDLEGTARRLRVSRATIKRHARYLRELGALVWVSHGSQRNSRAARGLDGYAGTATVYAATIPAVYDHAMGHRIVGSGYTARIVVDHRNTPAKPVDNSEGQTEREPLSLTMVKESGQVQVVGGVTTTGKPESKSTAPTKTKPRRKRRTILGQTITAAGMQLGDRLARTLRRHFPWLQKASHDEIRWVCADMAERGWSEQQAVNFTYEAATAHRDAGLMWQPEKPHAILAAHLRQRETQHLEDQARIAAHGPFIPAQESRAWVAMTEARAAAEQQAEEVLSALFPAQERTDLDRQMARMDWNNWPEVADHLEEDWDDAMDLYGDALCTYAVRKSAEANFRRPAYA